MISYQRIAKVMFGLPLIGLLAHCQGADVSSQEDDVAHSEQAVTAPFLTPRRERIGVFDAGGWALDLNGNGFWDGCGVDRCLAFGGAGDQPLVGNWGGPGGFDTLGVYNPTDRAFYLDFNGNGIWEGCSIDRCYSSFMTLQAGDRGVAGRWASTTLSGVGIFRNGQWFLDWNRNGVFNGCVTDRCGNFGQAGDVPVVGDWNAGGLSDVGVFQNGAWFLDTGNRQWSGCGTDLCGSFGQAGDLPFSWRPTTGNQTDIGVFRTGEWFLDANEDLAWSGCTDDDCVPNGFFGGGTQLPVSGDWPQIQWARYGDQTFSNGLDTASDYASMWENSSIVVGPGSDAACPQGRAFVGLGGAGQVGVVGLLQADLPCLGTVGCAEDIYPTLLEPLLENTPGVAIQDPEISNDNQLARLANGDILYVRQARRRSNPGGQTGIALRDQFVDAGAYIMWRSTDCGDTWEILPGVVADDPAILGGECGLRQGASTVAVYRPSDNTFYIDRNGNYTYDPGASFPDVSAVFSGMTATDIPVVGDWNSGQGTTIGYFRNGLWRLDFNGDYNFTNCTVDLCFDSFGMAGDVPVVGRWTEPGTAAYKPDLRSQIGVFRNGFWFLDVDSDGAWNPAIDQTIAFGMAGDLPVVGQWDNTGLFSARTRVGVFRPSTNEWILDAGPDGWQGCGTDICFSSFGGNPQVPISGIWLPTPDYQERVGTFENGAWHRDLNGNHFYDGGAETAGTFGVAGDIPLSGYFAGSFGGFDRVEVYADPFNGMTYMTSSCDYRNLSDTVLYSSADGGETWNAVRLANGRFTPTTMTSVSGSNKLYLFNPNGPDARLWPANVDTTANVVTPLTPWFVYQDHGPFLGPTPPNSSSWTDRSLALGTVMAGRAFDGTAGVTRIGRTGSVDSIRVFYPSLEQRGGTGVDTQVMRVVQVDVTTTPTDVSGMARTSLGTISASANLGSVTQGTVVEGPANIPIDLVYWKETDGSAAGALGAVRVRARLFKEVASANVNLSLDAAGQARTWNTWALTGDYQKGASYAQGNVAVFFTQWVETPSPGNRSLHSHFVDARFP